MKLGIVLYLLLGLVSFATWLTHVIVCIETSRWGLLIAGALFFPVGMVHGLGVWFGFWP